MRITNPLAQTVSGRRTVPGLQIRLRKRYRGRERCWDYISACANGIGAENGAGITNPLAQTVSGRRTVPGLQIRLRERYRGRERCRDYIPACANGIGVENGAGITYPLARTASGQRDGRQTPDADFAAGGVVTPCAFAVEGCLCHLDAIGGKACGVVGGGKDIFLLKIF